jgi:hypothetical protein
VVPLDIDSKVLQDFSRKHDESTHNSQEASQSQALNGAHQGLDGREGVAPARQRTGIDADRKSGAATQAKSPFRSHDFRNSRGR